MGARDAEAVRSAPAGLRRRAALVPRGVCGDARPFFVAPAERYGFDHPLGAGADNSPFFSVWVVDSGRGAAAAAAVGAALSDNVFADVDARAPRGPRPRRGVRRTRSGGGSQRRAARWWRLKAVARVVLWVLKRFLAH